MKEIAKNIFKWIKKKLKADGWATVLIVIAITFLLSIGLALTDFKDRIETVEWTEAVQDRVIIENQDSLDIFMSVIIECNKALIDARGEAKHVILAEVKKPAYANRRSKTEILWTKPRQESIFLWIPIDFQTWEWCEPGKDLRDRTFLYIGSHYFNKDLKKTSIKVVSKHYKKI
jgi:hypothetical protein